MRKIILVILAIIAGAGFGFGRSIPISVQWPLYESLGTVSGIIFGVIGVWIAVIYPGALAEVLDPRSPTRESCRAADTAVRSASRLLAPMRYSLFILLIVLGTGYAAPIMRLADFARSHPELVRGISYSVLGVATTIQFWSLILAVLPGVSLQRVLSAKADRRRKLAKMRTLNSLEDREGNQSTLEHLSI